MKKILLLNFLLIPLLIHSQSVKKIKNQLDNNSIETYYVLKSDESIKHGSYKLVTNRVVLEKEILLIILKAENGKYSIKTKLKVRKEFLKMEKESKFGNFTIIEMN